MRVVLTPFPKRYATVIYSCLVAHFFLGKSSLADMPALCSGFDSIENSLSADQAIAIRNLRLAGAHPRTLRALRKDIENYQYAWANTPSRNEETHPFVVNSDFSFELAWSGRVPSSIEEALAFFQSPLEVRQEDLLETFDPSRSAFTEPSKPSEGRFRISPLGYSPVPRPIFGEQPRSVGVQDIPILDLLAQADKFDKIDVKHGRQKKDDHSWRRRLTNPDGSLSAQLLMPGPGGAVPTNVLNLSGVKHLIGLPGAGKSTLLYLIASWAFENKKRVFFAFPSIAVATIFLDTLAQYDVDVALLYGQGGSSRFKHVSNHASALGQKMRGLGQVRPSSKFYATNCALAGFASDEQERFPHDRPPCISIRQGKSNDSKRESPRACALSSECGRLHGDRALATMNVWAGHVLSLKRKVPLIFSKEKITFFEYVSKYFDLMVIDECDMAQSAYDDEASPSHVLYGEKESVASLLIEDVHVRAAGGSNSFLSQPRIPEALSSTASFTQASDRLTSMVLHSQESFRDANANKLHTSQTLLSDIFSPVESLDDELHEAFMHRLDAIETLWDTAIKVQIFGVPFSDDDDDDGDRYSLRYDGVITPAIQVQIERCAVALGITEDQAVQIYQSYVEVFSLWLRLGSPTSYSALLSVFENTPHMPLSIPKAELVQFCGLLLCVSEMLLRHFALSPHLRYLHSIDLVRDDLTLSGKGQEEDLWVPASLAGSLSGVRYTIQEPIDGSTSHDVSLYLVDFRNVARLLPKRMHRESINERGSMSLLFTSATSLLEASPSFHNVKSPDYVLSRPNSSSGWENSHYEFFPITGSSGTALRFSGAPINKKLSNLKEMVKHLLGLEPKYSKVYSAMSQNGKEHGIERKVGFVVNSYDQCEEIFNFISKNLPAWTSKVRYLTRPGGKKNGNTQAITTSEIETLNSDDSWDVVIFPMSAIGRGVNIVFPSGKRQGQAKIGSLFFLTRPHPRGDSLQLAQGIVARRSEDFDNKTFATREMAIAAFKEHRRSVVQEIKSLLRLPLVSSRLGKFRKAFVADQMIMILQTIGRAMRGDQPAFVYFVDSAWAPKSAGGGVDTADTSMLVGMGEILSECLSHPDGFTQTCYESLYRPFFKPLSEMVDQLKAQEKTHEIL